jgi:hypothetical protein
MAKRESKSKRNVKRRGRPPRQDVFIEFQRVRLFEALGIIEVSRHALASKLTTLDEESVMDALRAVYRIVNDVAEALEIVIAGLPRNKSEGDSLGSQAATTDL